MNTELKSRLSLIPATPLLFDSNSSRTFLGVSLAFIELKGEWCLVYISDLGELEPFYNRNFYSPLDTTV
jgi:hypothetical protein